MIEINHLNKSYGRQQVLHDINLTLAPGQCVAFIGPNGCGKTTLMKCILGLATPQSGQVVINGFDVRRHPETREHIGFMPQSSCFPENMTVGQTFATIEGLRKAGGATDRELYDAFHIADIAGKRTNTLSGGTSQKMNAALAFLFNPDILILDEPTASLDPLAAEILKDKIRKERGKLVFITSHILSELNGLATHVVFMEEGRIVFFKSVEQLLQEAGQQDITQAVMVLLRHNNKETTDEQNQ